MSIKPNERTDTTSLVRPRALVVEDREREVCTQWVKFHHDWWDTELERLRLPGGPLRVRARAEGDSLERRDVWALATDVESSDEAVLGLLWHALAWGAGTSLRMCRQRMASVAADLPRGVDLLRRSAVLSRTDPEGAYGVLHPDGQGALRGLGPAFGTKFLYFAGGGLEQHPSLILDSLVATTLHREGWASLHIGGGWPAATYSRYCDLARRWATELAAESSAAVAADQVEKWLFTTARNARNGQP